MARLVVTNEDLGKGLKVENNKVVVNVDDLSLPVDIHLVGAELDKVNKKIKFTFEGADELELPVADLFNTDTTNATLALNLVDDGRGGFTSAELVLTDSAGEEVKTDLMPIFAAIEAVIEANNGTMLNGVFRYDPATKTLEMKRGNDNTAFGAQAPAGSATAARFDMTPIIEQAVEKALDTDNGQWEELTSLGGVRLGYVLVVLD